MSKVSRFVIAAMVICTFAAGAQTYMQAALHYKLLEAYGQGKINALAQPEEIILDTEKEIAAAKKAGTNVSAFEARMPELKRAAYFFYAGKKVNDLKIYGQGKSVLYFLPDYAESDAKEALAKAEAAGADVSALENTLPRLITQAYFFHASREVDNVLAYSQGKLLADVLLEELIEGAREAVDKAIEKGSRSAPVLKFKLKRYEGKAKLYFAIQATSDLREYGEGKPSPYDNPHDAIILCRNAIIEARQSGEKVEFLELQLPKLEKKAMKRI